LNYSHSGVDYSYGVPYLYQITLGLVLIVSMVFTPYVLYLLARLGKWGWLLKRSASLIFGFTNQYIQRNAKIFVDQSDLGEGEAALAGENLTGP